jgi:acetyl/propionyl-CoA carboxylase alpha subunit/acetyl-CoA carboxylase carboxyltransferase component
VIKKLLVANRGEIAVRVLQSAAALGIETVAVYPEDDASCAHVRRAGHAVQLPGAGAAAYLDIGQIVEAATRTGCDAVHPGYGFLSESAAFAEACGRAGVTFVGPSVEALSLFGDKTRARQRARELSIPFLAGTDGPTDLAAAETFFARLAAAATDESPAAVMVKALAGGGGRGMRPVRRSEDLREAFDRCASEAHSAFGDGSLYVEQLLVGARHLEVQLVGDGTGAVSHLGDRDCSLQRRRQKVVELAPAPALDADLRNRLLEAAVRLGQSARYSGLATVEMLLSARGELVFLEVNPRIQVEHTVTEEITGLDLVEIGLRIAGGATLAELGLEQAMIPLRRGMAVQCRVNSETLRPDGTVQASFGTLRAFEPPHGRGIRVDTHGYAGYTLNPRYDSLLAKCIVVESGGDLGRLAARADLALADFVIDGVPTTRSVLRAILQHPAFSVWQVDTQFVDDHLADLLASASLLDEQEAARRAAHDWPQSGPTGDLSGNVVTDAPPGTRLLPAPLQGMVANVLVAAGDHVTAGAELVVLEAMKMEHVVTAPLAGKVHALAAKKGDVVAEGAPLLFFVVSTDDAGAAVADSAATDLDRVRPDLAESIERHRIGLDEGRPEVVARRHAKGKRMARENVADLCDPGSFLELGALTIAAQRARRTVADLIASTPADALVTGTATIGGLPCAVMAYDYTVLAGTQGIHNHKKKDRLYDLALRRKLPLVMYGEGGGGRPGDTDTSQVAQLDVITFRMIAQLAGRVPTVAIVTGYCFAGNAALVGCCDVIIATLGTSLGMGGPAMIEGGGLGVVAPGDVGPMSVQVANGVVDILVPDEAAATAIARRYLSYVVDPRRAQEPAADWSCADQRLLRHLVPENRVRSYAVRPIITTLVDDGSWLELRAAFGVGIITGFARIEGRAVAILANDPAHLGGAIDADAADKAARFLRLCELYKLPVISLCDTPGFMVGPDAERTATVRRFAEMFVSGARITTPWIAIVLRKGYGLGAMAMFAGDSRAPILTVSWPTGEFGGMGLEGGVRLGFRRELEAIADPAERQKRYQELVAAAYERGKGLSVAAVFEIDDVIDPADTRSVISRALVTAPGLATGWPASPA